MTIHRFATFSTNLSSMNGNMAFQQKLSFEIWKHYMQCIVPMLNIAAIYHFTTISNYISKRQNILKSLQNTGSLVEAITTLSIIDGTS